MKYTVISSKREQTSAKLGHYNSTDVSLMSHFEVKSMSSKNWTGIQRRSLFSNQRFLVLNFELIADLKSKPYLRFTKDLMLIFVGLFFEMYDWERAY